MGYAVAEAARDRGARVVLVSAPAVVSPPAGIELVRVATAAEMLEATSSAVESADALIMAAAVADYRPAHPEADKIKKDRAEMTIPLERTVDILGSLLGDYVRVGFAAESSDLERNAQTKLAEKHLHLIVGNDITAENSGFGSDTNRVTIMARDGAVERLPVLSKREVADRILDRVVPLLK
jgi:phosphopantothenoylcysteine decarboxylase/phosphopantothenate--cysteine ligase